MNQPQIENEDSVAREIFNQISSSKVNGFPFIAYTGMKAKNFSSSALHLKAPKNPKGIDNVLIQYEYGSDTYTVILDGSVRIEDVYADALAELIARRMGVI